MAVPAKNALDPFRAIISVINGSDMLRRAASAAGLRVDLTLNERDDYSHETRIRALTPRIFVAYDALNDDDRLVAAQAVFSAIAARDQGVADRVVEALARIGWEVRGANIVAARPDLREMFFPAGSPWDAFVVLRDLFAEAQHELLIVDPYCDGKVFQILAGRNLNAALRVRILCFQNAANVSAEATMFVQQHPTVTIEVRRNHDFHDRFVVLDGATCIHVGSSLNHAGTRAFMVSKVEDEQNRASLLTQLQTSWNNGAPVP